MSDIRIVDIAGDGELDATCTAAGDIRHRCPYVDELDVGTVVVEWSAGGATLELHALREWLDGFAEQTVSHEELTRTIYGALCELDRIFVHHVTTRWTTAGMLVEIRAGR